MTTILHVNASARSEASMSRRLSSELVERLIKQNPDAEIISRETVHDVDFLTQTWVEGTFTEVEMRTPEQKSSLAGSDRLVEEIKKADHIVIGTPIYNFSIPGSLKMWIDQICRPGMTFRAEPDKFVGLLKHKRVYLIIASGGTEVQGPMDFATNYLIHIFGFLGINDVSIIPADHLLADENHALEVARQKMTEALVMQAAE